MHPSKVARIHTSQGKERREEKKNNSVGKKLVRPGISNHAGQQTLHAFVQKAKPGQ